MNNKISFWEYTFSSKGEKIALLILITLIVGFSIVAFWNTVLLFIPVITTIITSLDLYKVYKQYQKIKEPTWTLLKYIQDNAEELAPKWGYTLQVEKNGKVVFEHDMDCFNSAEKELIYNRGISRLRYINDEKDKVKREDKRQKQRKEIMGVLND